MKQEQIIKCGGQRIKVFNCDPEKNTQCDKEFCMETPIPMCRWMIIHFRGHFGVQTCSTGPLTIRM